MGQLAGLIIFLIAVAFLLRLDFIFYVVYVCVGVFAWSRWYTPRAFANLRAERIYDRRAFWGETISVTLRLYNDNWLGQPWVQAYESIAPELRLQEQIHQVVSLPRRGTAEFSYRLKAFQRGYYQIGPLRLTSGDLYGLQPEQKGTLPAETLTVYPRIIPLSRLGLPSRLPFGTIASTHRLYTDPARPIGVRDFRSGDSLRQINWKVSARTRSLVVKTLESAISLETAVLLDLHAPTYGRMRKHYTEWAIEVAASLAAHLIDRRQAVGLITNGVDPLLQMSTLTFDEISGRLLTSGSPSRSIHERIPPEIPLRDGREHLMKILEQLARIEAAESIPFARWVPGACLHLSWGVTLLAITARGDSETCQTLHQLVRSGFNPILIAVEPDYNFGLVQERARRLGIAAYHVTQERDLAMWKRPSAAQRPVERLP